MLKHRVRNLAVAGFMIASAVVLTAAFAPSASATTPPTCVTSDVPWSCVQVFGSGLNVQEMNGWAHNQTGSTIFYLHIELYYAGGPQPPLYGTPIGNCGQFNLPGGANSPNCSSGSFSFTGPAYACSAVWQLIHPTPPEWRDLGWVCVHVT